MDLTRLPKTGPAGRQEGGNSILDTSKLDKTGGKLSQRTGKKATKKQVLECLAIKSRKLVSSEVADSDSEPNSSKVWPKSDESTLSPTWILRREMWKELHVHRLYLNHTEVIDFTIFEYGQRRGYLHWRLLSLGVTIILAFYVFVATPTRSAIGGSYSHLIYMHAWTTILLVTYNLLEVIILIWTLINIPTRILVRTHYTPWYFKMTWLMHNIIYANIMASNMMYFFGVRDIDKYIGHLGLCHAFLSSFVGVHVSLTAMPSRLIHFIHPVGFCLIHTIFTYIYQYFGGTNPNGNNYVYLEMDWVRNKNTAFVTATIWILLTIICHCTIVFCCWCRRAVYRCHRSTWTNPVYGLSPVEYCPLAKETGLLEDTDLSCYLTGQLTDATVEAAPSPQSSITYSPHMSYRQNKVSKVRRCLANEAASYPPTSAPGAADTDEEMVKSHDLDSSCSRPRLSKCPGPSAARNSAQTPERPPGRLRKDSDRVLRKNTKPVQKGKGKKGKCPQPKSRRKTEEKSGGDAVVATSKREDTDLLVVSKVTSEQPVKVEEGRGESDEMSPGEELEMKDGEISQDSNCESVPVKEDIVSVIFTERNPEMCQYVPGLATDSPSAESCDSLSENRPNQTSNASDKAFSEDIECEQEQENLLVAPVNLT